MSEQVNLTTLSVITHTLNHVNTEENHMTRGLNNSCQTPSIQVRLYLIVALIQIRLAGGLKQILQKNESNRSIFSDFQTKIWLKSFGGAAKFFGCSSITRFLSESCTGTYVAVFFFGGGGGYLLQTPCQSDRY